MGRTWMEVSGDGAPERLEIAGRRISWPDPQAAQRLEFHPGPPLVVQAIGGDIEEWGEDGGGLAFEFAGRRFTLRMEAALEEVTAEPADGFRDPSARLLRAGILLDLGFVDPSLRSRLQRGVLEGSFDPDAAATAILEGDEPSATRDTAVHQRAGRLLRDFLMANRQRGVSGLARHARTGAKNLLAAALAQVLALGVYTLLLGLAVLFWRARGASVDAWLDSILQVFGAGRAS